MKTPTLYLDSSVLGGYFDEEFKKPTRELWNLMKRGVYQAFCSVVVEQEISTAPRDVLDLFQADFPGDVLLPLSEEAIELARSYVQSEVVVPKYLTDARHVAVCSIARLDYLVSWNFRHMVNVRREAGFNAVNLLQGYRPVRIISPLELIYETEEDD